MAACVDQALASLAQKVMEDDSYRSLLQQTYSVALDASGVGDPLAATGSITGVAGEILMDGIRFGAVTDGSNNILKPLTHYSDFLGPQLTVFGYYCLKDRKILTRAIDAVVNGPADIQSAATPLSVVASFQPAVVDNVPAELEDMAIQELVSIVATKSTNANA